SILVRPSFPTRRSSDLTRYRNAIVFRSSGGPTSQSRPTRRRKVSFNRLVMSIIDICHEGPLMCQSVPPESGAVMTLVRTRLVALAAAVFATVLVLAGQPAAAERAAPLPDAFDQAAAEY